MIVTLIFLVSNVVFTFASLQLGYNFYGYGYLIACTLAVAVAYFYLDRHLKNLEYYTFVSQPVVS